ncbi:MULTISPECIES: delta-poly-L-ornithine synthetase PosA [unclassified Acinetobacter]|uniref:delta-poly-L-ornithine synthetase PosA n=1 Tax=unclassified Acinetobacter TaxID=196816 RepID=UPI002449B3C4|nr:MULTISPECIES: delta-poly-L-ornithine synthetase PosA [unclassified Acinetobacter]MDH0031691.1 amino acid adenylation domain-containing protein [Acinetobacter sp. GD04021]MDH0887464.1 amino acid adenylation domain-containing protein [Acinetobacter sp. GD03873]MDH1083805.1 amino acid adenylation domain-containing protein [Acinetobacter sp. GD03983]MDH2190780.1 amino acid adenylation domain-containing protein [Acinetobacter sp. GD03645]MDH2204332.1 amino acid adenylation domain-containing prot
MQITAIVRGTSQPEFLKQEVLADIFTETVQRIPDQVALIEATQQISYAELYRQASNMAQHLILNGVKAGDIVGLWLPRGIELLTSQLAICLSGAAWLPFDMDTPADRMAVCLEDANAVGMITSTEWYEHLEVVPQSKWTATELQRPQQQQVTLPKASPDQPAYIIYTSGSTGKPKGIVITQKNICHFLRSENSILGIQQQDKVYQGFSVAFDMSFEEIWLSYLVGASLWIAPKSLVSDPERLCKTLQQENISVLHAVPTLLALFPEDVPNLRIINLGGEMCPDSLVERWALPHHQMFNTYGPTETTVSASLELLQRGKPVTIGKPLPNYGMLVINEERQLLPQGETGELCIFGPSVAQGYLGRPDLTADKFIQNPWAENPDEESLYRTGDLARIDEFGQVHCLGRADDQIKIRGFRVELGEIEAALCDLDGIGTAAVILRAEDGIDQLIAFIAVEIDSKQPIEIKQLRAALSQRLPPYMVPNRFEIIEDVPRLLSGKIDRKALKARPLISVVDRSESDLPQNVAEEVLFEILNRLFPNMPIKLDADFFDDLGGHSLLAAVLVSNLRQHEAYQHLTIQNLYQARKVGAIASLMLDVPQQAQNTQLGQDNPRNQTYKWLCGLAQLITIPTLISINILQWLAPFFTYHYFTGGARDSIPYAIFLSLLVYVSVIIASFAVSIGIKRLLMLGVKAGRYPLWGMTYFRWWLADRIGSISPVYLLSGSTLLNLYLKALGAKIGHDVNISSVHIRMPSLLTIEDGVSIGSNVNLENAKVEHGHLVLGSITLKQDSYVGSYAVLEENTVLEAKAHVNALTAIEYNTTVPVGEIWDGTPARKIGHVDELTKMPARPALSFVRKILEYGYYAVSALIIACIFFIPIFPSFILVDWLDVNVFNLDPNNHLQIALYYFLLAIPASAMMMVMTAVISSIVRKVALPNLKTGTYPVHGGVYYRKWFAAQILETSLQTLHGLFATVYAPTWFRMLGAKVGKNTEISTATGVIPEMLSLGDESFIADAVMLGDEEIKGGWMTLKSTQIGHRSFVGNSAYIADGTVLPDNVLIGVQSKTPDNREMYSGQTWFGSPALLLPAREAAQHYPDHLTFKPGIGRRLMRGFIEGLRIVLPAALAIGVGYMIVLEIIDVINIYNVSVGLLALTLAGLLYGVGCFIIVALLKWMLIGRYQPKSAPMWTMFVWLSEGITSLYESVAIPNFLNYLRGTPMLPFFLRLLGVKIGRDVYLDTADITEFDCVKIGDRAEFNSFSGPQTHLFEDRIMKIGQVNVGNDVVVNARGIILYNANVDHHAVLGPLTLVMKGENIPAKSAWIGSPAVPWNYH